MNMQDVLKIFRNYPEKLADRLGVSSPTVTRGVQKLHKDGYLVLVKEGKCIRHNIPAYLRGNTLNT